MSIATKCNCGMRPYYCDLSFEGCHQRIRQNIPIEFLKIPGDKGSDINKPNDSDNLIEKLKESVDNLNADKLLRDYWELLNNVPVWKDPEAHRAWFKKLEAYIKIQTT